MCRMQQEAHINVHSLNKSACMDAVCAEACKLSKEFWLVNLVLFYWSNIDLSTKWLRQTGLYLLNCVTTHHAER